MKETSIDGLVAYNYAIALTDLHGCRFCDMLLHDYQNSEFERKYFVGAYGDFPVMGWSAFCREMVESGQDDLLEKINRLDEQVMARTLEKQLLDYQRQGNKEGVDLCVKALSGIVSKRKIEPSGSDGGGSDRVLQVFITGEKGLGDGEN